MQDNNKRLKKSKKSCDEDIMHIENDQDSYQDSLRFYGKNMESFKCQGNLFYYLEVRKQTNPLSGRQPKPGDNLFMQVCAL